MQFTLVLKLHTPGLTFAVLSSQYEVTNCYNAASGYSRRGNQADACTAYSVSAQIPAPQTVHRHLGRLIDQSSSCKEVKSRTLHLMT